MCRVIDLERRAFDQFALDVGEETLNDLGPLRDRLSEAMEDAHPFGEAVGVLVGLSTEHHAIDMRELVARLSERADAAVRDHLELREVKLDLVHEIVAKRRDFAVFFRAEAGEPGLARMDDDRPATGRGDGFDEALEKVVVVVLVDPDPGLDRNREADRASAWPRQSCATNSGSAIRQAPKRALWTRSEGQPTFRLISS